VTYLWDGDWPECMVYANIPFEKETEISRVGAMHNPDGSLDFGSSFSITTSSPSCLLIATLWLYWDLWIGSRPIQIKRIKMIWMGQSDPFHFLLIAALWLYWDLWIGSRPIQIKMSDPFHFLLEVGSVNWRSLHTTNHANMTSWVYKVVCSLNHQN